MNKILELREKRAKLWDNTKAFLDSRRSDQGVLSAEDTATYENMEADVVSLGKEIDRLERQAVLDLELAKPTATAITNKPSQHQEPEKTGRASNEYKAAFWKAMRNKSGFEVQNALQTNLDATLKHFTDTFKTRSASLPAEVPTPMKLALLVLVCHFYEERAGEEIPPVVYTLLSPYRNIHW